jgi:hypothetical protein
MGGNKVSDISPLATLTSLAHLYLWSNQISDLSPLSKLTSLTYLSLWRNRIADISPLVENSGLGKGTTVDLAENPLDAQSIDVYIPQLEQRGVNLGWGTSHPAIPTPTPKPTPLTTPPPEVTPSPTPTPAPSPAPTPTPVEKAPFNTWVIIGPILGVLAACGAVFYFLRRRK